MVITHTCLLSPSSLGKTEDHRSRGGFPFLGQIYLKRIHYHEDELPMSDL